MHALGQVFADPLREQPVVRAARVRAAAPAAIVLLHKSTAEYGCPWFGKLYAKGVLYGDERLRDGSHYGVRVLWRKDLAPR